MKLLLTVLFMFICCGAAFAQQDTLQSFNNSRDHIKNTGMEVLGGWAIANIAVGTIGWYNSKGSTRYFHQMNIIWNVVNLSLAIPGYLSARQDYNRPLSAAESLQKQQKLEKIFLINAGLDFVYIGGGAYLRNRGNAKNSDRLRGYGSSIILQGAFLLLFDGAMYGTERHSGNKLRHFLASHPVTFTGKQIGMLTNF